MQHKAASEVRPAGSSPHLPADSDVSGSAGWAEGSEVNAQTKAEGARPSQ